MEQGPRTEQPTEPTAHRASAGADEGDTRADDRRESVVDRRTGLGRRQAASDGSAFTGTERRASSERRAGETGLERRRGPGRRRADDRRSAEEGEMTAEQFEFCMAIETYKKVNRRMFPTWTEVLEVITQLGYRKVQSRNMELDNVPEPTLTKVA